MLGWRCVLRTERHASRSLVSKRPLLATEPFQLLADDFKHGFHLEVGDPPKPTDRSPDGSKAKQCLDLPTPGPQGQRRRVVATYEVGPGSEHIRTCGMSGYPSPTDDKTYPEEGGSGYAR